MASPGDDEGSFLVNRRFIRRRDTDIAREQERLLFRPDAWDTKGVTNVPPKVLQDSKEKYSRKLESAADSDQSTPEGRSRTTANGSSRQKSAHSRRGAKEDEARRRDTDDSDDAEPIPWTPSPTSHKQAPVRRDEPPLRRPSNPHPPSSSPVRSGKQSVPPSSPPPSSPTAPESLPPPSSPPLPVKQAYPRKNHPGSRLVVALKAKSVQPPPSSSIASEPDLEFQPPRAITDIVSPVVRVLGRPQQPPPASSLEVARHRSLRSTKQPAPTPPSAQEPVTVPCTWKEPGSSTKRPLTAEEPAQKRRRLHKPPPFESSQAVEAHATASLSASRLEPVIPKESQTTNSSSALSVIPGTPARRLPSARHGRESDPRALLGDGVLSIPINPVQDASLSSSGRLPPNGPPSQAPFVAFKMAYPTYTGKIGDFVRAALNIMQLQESRALPEFLYDDFIRMWAQHYMPYMKDCVQNGDGKPLRAIQWYNEYVPAPVFTKRIFTKGNIADIPSHYRSEAESSRRDTGRPLSRSSSLLAAISPTVRVSSQLSTAAISLARPPLDVNATPLPVGTSAQVATTATPSPGGESARRKDTDPAQAAQPVANQGANMHIMLRPDQTVRIEPLRSVSGYVVSMSQPGSSSNKSAEGHRSPVPAAPPEIKEEEGDGVRVLGPLVSADTMNLINSLPAARLAQTSLPPADEIPSPPPIAQTSTNRDAPSAPVPRTNPPAKDPTPPRPVSPLPSYRGILTQPPATAESFISDFSKSIIPETAVKPGKNAATLPRFEALRGTARAASAGRRVSRLGVSSQNGPPASSATAAPTSSAAERRRLTKPERFRLFVQRQRAEHKRAGRDGEPGSTLGR